MGRQALIRSLPQKMRLPPRPSTWIWVPLKKVLEQVSHASPGYPDFLVHVSVKRPPFIYTNSDAETLKREEEAIQLDGLNVAQLKEIREKVGVSFFFCISCIMIRKVHVRL